MSMSSPKTHVFTNDNGERCKFFVEAAAVRERPALIRKIVKNGGSIVNTALDADIVLAESNTKEALELFEAWRGDRTLLSTRWVARCLDESAFLGSDRGWAGYELTLETLRQGIANSGVNEDEEEDEELEKPTHSHLPAPSSQAAKTSPNKQTLPRASTSRLGSKAASSNKPRQRHSSSAERAGDQGHPNPSASPHVPASQSPLKDTPQSSQNPTSPTNTPLPTPSQLALQQSLLASMLTQALQSPQQPINPDQYASGQVAFPQLAPFFTPSLFQQVLAQQMALSQQPLSSQPMGSSEQSGPNTEQQPSSIQGSPNRPTPEDVDSDYVLGSDISSVTSEEAEVEISISRRRGARKRVMSDSSTEREIQTAIRSNPPRARETIPKKAGIFVNGKGVSQKFYVMIDLKNRKDLLKIIRKHNGVIVSQMDGADYIVLNIRSTQFQKALDILPVHQTALSPTWIEECEKANKLVDVASYAIDVSSGVGRGAARKKPAAKAQRSASEDDKNKASSSPLRIQDPTPKPMPKPMPKPAPKPTPTSTIKPSPKTTSSPLRVQDPTSTSTLKPVPETASTPLRVQDPTPTSTLEPVPKMASSALRVQSPTPKPSVRPALRKPTQAPTLTRSRSPSPFPPTDVEPVRNDTRFTENDRVWFLTYARFKLERNPTITYDALIHAVGRKAPYHSLESWDNAWRTMWPEEMRALKQEIDAAVQRRVIEVPSSSDPKTTRETQNELTFSEVSAPPLPSLASPIRTAPTGSSSQAESSCTSPLKRKENPNGEPVGNEDLDQHNKRVKTTQDGRIDVDSFPNSWLKPT